MDDNDSYDLAADYVRQQIKELEQSGGLFEQGDLANVLNMEKCDCIPIDVTDRTADGQAKRRWQLYGVDVLGTFIHAEYKLL